VSTLQLLSELAAANIRLQLRGDSLQCLSPKGALTEALSRGIRTHRDELIALLRKSVPEQPLLGESVDIPRVPEDLPVPLTHVQERMWFLDQLMGPNHVYNISVAVPLLNRPLDLRALTLACNTLIARHAILRTAFVLRDGIVKQVLVDDAVIAPRVLELSREYAQDERAARDAELRDILRRESRTPFELARAPLFRMIAVRLAPDSHVLLMMLHHIVSDGWSNGILVRDLTALYGAFSRGAEPQLPPVEVQYRNYAAWQRQRLDGSAGLKSQLDYWLNRLRDLPPLLELPYDRPRPAVARQEGSTLPFQLDAQLSAALRELAAHHRVSLFMLLLAAFQVLIARYSGRKDVAVGSPLTNRRHSQLEEMVGPCINTVVLRSAVDPGTSFLTHLQQVRSTVLEAFDNQDVPFEQIVSGLRVPRTLAHEPLVQVGFLLKVPAPGEVLAPGAGKVSELFGFDIRDITGYSKLDLTVMTKEEGPLILGWFEYNTDLFAGASVRRMIEHYRHLLASIAARAAQLESTRLGDLELMPPDERRAMLRRGERAAEAFEDLTTHELVVRQARATPGAVALISDAARLSYAELLQASRRVAAALRARGAGPGTVIPLFMNRSADAVIAMLAVLECGAAYLPLDPSYPQARIAHMLTDSAPAFVLTHAEVRHLLPDTAARVVVYETVTDGAPDEVAEPPRGPAPRDLAYVIYTSGSTGKPKGVMIEHRALANFLQSMAREPGMTPTDRLLALTTFSFDIAALEIFLPLIRGATVVLASRAVATDPRLLADELRRHRITMLQATPATWRMLLASGWEGAPGLKALCGGEALSSQLARELISRVDSLWNMYGPTETTVWSACRAVREAAAGNGVETIGAPIANTGLFVLDTTLQPAPQSVIGELCISGAGLARGYLNQPQLTDERFVTLDVEGAAVRMYRTGDLARWNAAGQLDFLGRNDGQVKVRGFRIELGEIEARLCEHPAVSAAAVAARPDVSGELRLVAYVVGERLGDGALDALRDFCRQSLPEHMVPAQFARLDALPLTANGKVNRAALPEIQRAAPRSHEPPQGATEEAVAQIWAALLSVTVGRHDDFFALGGHSLLAVRMAAEVERSLEVTVPVSAIFEAPTLAEFALRAQRPASPQAPAAEPRATIEGFI
jgi:amino acid adenylation domain-containing protein